MVTVCACRDDSVTVAVAIDVPALPSAMVTSPMLAGRDALVIDDRARGLGVRDGGVHRRRQVDDERFVELERGVAVDRHVDGLVVVPAAKVAVPLAAT